MSDTEIVDKLVDITEGTIDHLDIEDAMNMLYDIKKILSKRNKDKE